MQADYAGVIGSEWVEQPADERIDGVSVCRVVRPGSAGEVAACLTVARRDGTPLVASAGGTKLGWGNRPAADALVRLDLSRLSGPFQLDPDEGVVTAPAGLPVVELERAAASAGKRTLLALAPAGATLGGSIAADPIRPELTSDCRLRNDLLGLEVALPDGSLTRSGGRVVKNVTGFDLVRLYCGSLGTLGVITQATLRLRPRPQARCVLSREVDSPAEALELAHGLMISGAATSGAVLAPSSSRLRLTWLLEGAEAEVEAYAARLEGNRCGTEDWDALGPVVAGTATHPAAELGVRLAGRPSDTLSMFHFLETAAGADALRASLPLVGIVLAEVAADVLPAMSEESRRRGWALFVERAPARLKSELDVFGPAPDSLDLMRALKQRFDPQRVLSPGRFVGRI